MNVEVLVGELCIAVAAVTVASLGFVKWAVEREDRLDVVHTPRVRALRRGTLEKQREVLEQNIVSFTRGGHHSLARDFRRQLDAVDGQLAALDRIETAPEEPWSRDD